MNLVALEDVIINMLESNIKDEIYSLLMSLVALGIVNS